jgi:hypothetical protein
MEGSKFITFVKENNPTYVCQEDSNYKISLKHLEKCDFLSAKHFGWRCQSMYNDSPPENGCCDVREAYQNERYQWVRGLFLNFTSDDYSEQVYLMLEVSDDFQTLTVVKDWSGKEGMKLKIERHQCEVPIV